MNAWHRNARAHTHTHTHTQADVAKQAKTYRCRHRHTQIIPTYGTHIWTDRQAWATQADTDTHSTRACTGKYMQGKNFDTLRRAYATAHYADTRGHKASLRQGGRAKQYPPTRLHTRRIQTMIHAPMID